MRCRLGVEDLIAYDEAEFFTIGGKEDCAVRKIVRQTSLVINRNAFAPSVLKPLNSPLKMFMAMTEVVEDTSGYRTSTSHYSGTNSGVEPA